MPPAAALMCWRARRIFTALTGSASFPCGKTTAFSLQAQGTDQTDGGGALKEWAYQDERFLFSEKKGVLYDAVVVLADTGEKYVNYKIELPPRPKTKGKG